MQFCWLYCQVNPETLFPTSSTHTSCPPSPLLWIGTGCCLVPGLTLLQSLLFRKQQKDAAKCELDHAPRPKWANSCPSKWKKDSALFLCPGKPWAIWPGSPPPSFPLFQLVSSHITQCHLRAFAPVAPSVCNIHLPWKTCKLSPKSLLNVTSAQWKRHFYLWHPHCSLYPPPMLSYLDRNYCFVYYFIIGLLILCLDK